MSDASDRKRTVAADDVFFRKHPERRYRVRRAAPVEIREKQLNGGLPTLPPGLAWFVAIWSRAPGHRLCLFIQNIATANTDLDEGMANVLFDYAWVSCSDLSRVASVSRMAGAMKADMEPDNATHH